MSKDSPVSKMKTVTYNVFDYEDFGRFVEEKTGINVTDAEVIAAEEWSNDSSYTFDNCKGELEEWTKKSMKDLPGGKTYGTYLARTWIEYFVSTGKLSPGNYMISVFW